MVINYLSYLLIKFTPKLTSMNFNLTNIIVSLIILIFICCSKERLDYNNADLVQYLHKEDTFYCEAIKEVNPFKSYKWIGDAYFYLNKNEVNLNISTYSDTTGWSYFDVNANLRENLYFGFKLNSKGELIVKNQSSFDSTKNEMWSSYYTAQADGDVIDAYWGIANNPISTFKIDELDLNKGILVGEFNCYYKLIDFSPSIPRLHYINFTNASFKAKRIK